MGQRRFLAAIGAALLAVTAVIGVSGPAQASETPGDWTKLCVDGAVLQCILAQGSGKAVKISPNNGTMTNWLYPDPGQINVIKQANTNLCLQANVSGTNVVVEATCNTSNSAQLWSIRASAPFLVFESRLNTTDCLTYNQSAAGVDIHGCSNAWYEGWAPPAG